MFTFCFNRAGCWKCCDKSNVSHCDLKVSRLVGGPLLRLAAMDVHRQRMALLSP